MGNCPNVPDRPASSLLAEWEAEGFTFAVRDNRLFVHPADRLTPAHRERLVRDRDVILMLQRVSDAGTRDRFDVFRAQLEAAPVGTIPAFLFLADVAYVAGRCFSCGDQTGRGVFGRCWRCSLAWRLACRVPIPPELVVATDKARHLTYTP